jgi:recombination protein RecR
MKYIPNSVQKVIEAFNKLPGIGSKTAERLAFYLLKKPDSDVEQFGQALLDMKKGLLFCRNCYNLSTEENCAICRDGNRQKEVICVVEDVLDLIALEKTSDYTGFYHVLHGIISPVEGVGPEELTIGELIRRVEAGGIQEVIFALNPSMEGEATAAYIMRALQPMGVKVTRIARGIPVGGNLEYADSQTLKRALEGRMDY